MMEVQETIAFIGGVGRNCPVLMRRMAQGKLRLLFLFNEDDKNVEFVEQLKAEQDEDAEIELVNCAKSGCWEADIIAFVDPEAIEEELLNKIKEVATQKIVLLITTEKGDNSSSFQCKEENLRKDLPYSKPALVKVDSAARTASISAEDEEVAETISAVFRKAGYTLKE